MFHASVTKTARGARIVLLLKAVSMQLRIIKTTVILCVVCFMIQLKAETIGRAKPTSIASQR